MRAGKPLPRSGRCPFGAGEAALAEGGERDGLRKPSGLNVPSEKASNDISGDDVLWRETAMRPAHIAVALLAPLKSMMGLSSQPAVPCSKTAISATSLLKRVTYIDRSAAKG